MLFNASVRRVRFAVIVVFSFSLFCARIAAAEELSLASPFTDHAVVQRDQKIAVWGTAAAGDAISVTLSNRQATAKADSAGKWTVTLEPLSAGGPFTLHVQARSASKDVMDVLIGDVWLCSGQSNMQMTLKETADATADMATAATHPQMRLLTIEKKYAAKEESRFEGQWKLCSPATAAEFSAVAYLFGHELYKSPKLHDVPIGLIDSSFGGTVIEGWIPSSTIAEFPKDEIHGSMFGIGSSAFYNAMIAPLIPYDLKGVIWYQGEGNASYPQSYAQFLTAMIKDWRANFRASELPFFIVELPPNNGDWGGYYFSWLRDMQRQVAQNVPRVDLATTVNTHDGSDLHPKEKHEIGTRLALLARRDAYGEQIIATGPVFKSASPEGSKVKVTFDTAGSPLTSRSGGVLGGFEVAGADGQYRFAEAKIESPDVVVVHSDGVAEPKTVRYAWDPVPQADLYNAAGLPAPPFRTDTASPEPLIEVLPLPAPRRVTTPDYEFCISGGGKIIDLSLHGQQFVSNAPGGNGGSSIPLMFGFRDLREVHSLGPNCIRFHDNEVAATFTCERDEMSWNIDNSGGQDLSFRLALAPQVEVIKKEGDELDLRRGDASIRIAGFSTINQTSEGGKLLEVKVPAKSSATLRLGFK